MDREGEGAGLGMVRRGGWGAGRPGEPLAPPPQAPGLQHPVCPSFQAGVPLNLYWCRGHGGSGRVGPGQDG